MRPPIRSSVPHAVAALLALSGCGSRSDRYAADASHPADAGSTDAAGDAATSRDASAAVDAAMRDAGPVVARSVTAGDDHTCALGEDGRLLCWGDNASGQLGDGTTAARPTAGPVLAGLTVVTASAGGAFTCAAIEDGTAYCWGRNIYGTLGIGSASSRERTPRTVMDLAGVVAVAAAFEHVCALRSGGTVACWGLNASGQLGNGVVDDAGGRAAPVDVIGLADAIAITTAASFSCAIRDGGQVVCWGANSGGQLGDGTTVYHSSPVAASGLADAVAISAGSPTLGDSSAAHACAVRSDGRVACWGDNASGQLGDGTTTASLVPIDVPGITDATAVAAGALHTCALRGSGEVLCWGDNANGQLGDATRESRPSPVAVADIADAVAIAAGTSHTCAVRAGGGVACWGSNGWGQLGDGTGDDRLSPTPVLGL